MSVVELSKEEKEVVVRKIQAYVQEELDFDIGQFDAEFLLDFFSQHIGAYYYNQGLYDARSVLESKLKDIDDALYEIEKPTEFSR